jgi:hypothetical protein
LKKNHIFARKDRQMGENELSMVLKKQAVELGLCEDWQREWKRDTSKQELIDKYFNGLDFPMRHHWPSNNYIKDNFGQELLRRNNILVDDKYSLLNPQEAVILGNAEAAVRVNGHNHSVIYIRDNSAVKLYVKNTAFVIVHLFETAHVEAQIFDSPNVLILKHSKDVNVTTVGKVKIKEDFDYLK